MKENGINTMEWPPSSPDLNPIECLWTIIDQELAKVGISSVQQMKNKIQEIWNNLDVALCQRLALSLPKRVSTVLKARGHSIEKY